MLSMPTTPPELSGLSPHEASPVEASVAICPKCGSIDTVKHGTYTRNPHGRAPVRVQRYLWSICGRTFSPSLSYAEDGHQYPIEVKRLGRLVNAFTDTSLENLQDICTVHRQTPTRSGRPRATDGAGQHRRVSVSPAGLLYEGAALWRGPGQTPLPRSLDQLDEDPVGGRRVDEDVRGSLVVDRPIRDETRVRLPEVGDHHVEVTHPKSDVMEPLALRLEERVHWPRLRRRFEEVDLRPGDRRRADPNVVPIDPPLRVEVQAEQGLEVGNGRVGVLDRDRDLLDPFD
jgi:hypothetical protein